MRIQTKILALSATISALVLQQASANVIGVDLGTGLPPATLGGYTMAAYDPGSIGGSDYYAHLTNGNGDGGGTGWWSTWGQNYTGFVYVTLDGSKTLTLSLSGVEAVYFYMEPNQFSDFTMTATDSSGVSVSTTINGYYGSSGVGFYSDVAGTYLTSIGVTCSDSSGFAIGEFGVNRGTIQGQLPDAGSSLALLGLAFAGLGGMRRYFA